MNIMVSKFFYGVIVDLIEEGFGTHFNFMILSFELWINYGMVEQLRKFFFFFFCAVFIFHLLFSQL